MPYAAVIFDFDYTLADATPAIVACANHALSLLGYDARGVGQIRRTVGMTLEETFRALTNCTDAEQAKRFRDAFRAKADEIMTDNTILLPDTVAVLEGLRGSGIQTGIVTSKYRYRIEQVLRKYSAARLIGYVVGFEDVPTAKPSPDGLFKAMEALGVERGQVLYVGDTTIDAQTARNAGVDFAAVTTGATPAAEFEAYPHVAIATNLTELMEVIS